jgi:sirohydrochlorin cobaltochelatase
VTVSDFRVASIGHTMVTSQSADVKADLAALDARINALLPPVYRGCYTDVPPTSMGSAGLKYGPDGQVAWDKIWTHFCDLALAGGPPHRGTLLAPADPAEVAADPEGTATVAAEVCRAVCLAAGLPAADGEAGWVEVDCGDEWAAAWLHLAVVAENVSAHRRGAALQVPAGPRFRIEKEVKNVTVALAKAWHYFEGHLSYSQQAAAGRAAVWEPATPADAAADPVACRAVAEAVATRLAQATGRPADDSRYVGWVGVDCGDEDRAVWLLRAVVSERVLARREGTTLYVPAGPRPDEAAIDQVVGAVARAWALNEVHERTVGSQSPVPPGEQVRRAGAVDD